MDPQVSTSFIPKEALAAQKARTGGVGLFFLLSLLVFVVSIIAAGASFAYAQYITKQLDVDRGAFDLPSIVQLQKLDTRIQQAKRLLQKHVALSGLFNFLSKNTLVNVQFTSFEYSLANDGSAAIQMDGTADSFATIA